MRKLLWILPFLLCFMASSGAVARSFSGPRLAFPGAEGFGATAKGGRGGDVYHVTNLGDSGAGSLREGIETAVGARTIVFEVGGVVDLQSPLWVSAERLTVAGQTAPGGIGLRGYPMVVAGARDLVLRYLRLRPGDLNAQAARGRPGQGNADLPGDAADALSIFDSRRVIVDHISASWGMDETLSVTSSRAVTVQHSIISESLNDSFHPEGLHGYGSLLRGVGGRGFTFFGNLYAHHALRSPAVGGEQTPQPGEERRGLDIEFVNNVVYDWGVISSHTVEDLARMRVNYQANVHIAGPTTLCKICVFTVVDPSPADRLSVHHAGNWLDAQPNGVFDPEPASDPSFFGVMEIVEEPFRFGHRSLAALPALRAYDRVLREAGASLPRDDVDRRVIRQVIEQSGVIIDSQEQVGGWPAVPPPRPPPMDLDRDGMADAWECRMGLDPEEPEDRNRFDLSRRYTNLEIYLHYLVSPDRGGLELRRAEQHRPGRRGGGRANCRAGSR
ncbi:MAG: pectate lyase [Deltaproteobacteria bacterium]|jgi:hypothetical protein|nr:pectate lyase [Deltaproteobacteria bacterium]